MSHLQVKTIQQEIVNLHADADQKRAEVAEKERSLKQMYADAVLSVSFYAGIPCGVKADANGIPSLVIDAAYKIGTEDDPVSLIDIWVKSGLGAKIQYDVVLPPNTAVGSTPVDGVYCVTASRQGSQISVDIDRQRYNGDNQPDFNNLELAGRIVRQFVLDSGCIINASGYGVWHNSLIEEIASKTALANDGQACLDQITNTL
jgi:hypothetical protein